MSLWRIALCSVKWIVKIIEYEKEVTGNWYIDLTDAVVNKLLELKAYWWCVQASTPTPTTPVDIKCNNGALKVRHQSGLPLGYTQLTYIQSDGRQVINTGYVLQETDSVEVDYKLTDLTRTGDKFILGAQPVSNTSIGGFWVETYNSSNIWYIRYGSSASANTYGSVTPTSQLSGTLAISKNSFVVNGLEILTPDFVSMPVNPMTIFNRISLDGSIPNNGASAQISEVRVKNGNNIVHKYIPVCNSNNELGMYDLVSGQFFTNQGSGDFTAGDPVNDLEIYTDGTVETINVHRKNLFDKTTADDKRVYGYFASSGTTWSYAGAGFSIRIPCKPNTEYTARYNGDSTQAVLGFGSTSNDDVPTDVVWSVTVTQWVRQNSPTIGTPITITTGANDKWLIVAYNMTEPQHSDMADNLQIEEWNTATTYEPYYDGGTATCEDLLWVWTYKDEQEILSGNVITKVGVVVLDWTEGWASYQSGACWAASSLLKDKVSGNSLSYSTHYSWASSSPDSMQNNQFLLHGTQRLCIKDDRFGTYTEFKQWLAQQYNAWTPVIVVYPLATPTTLSVAWQSLSIPAWDSRIEIVEWSILNLPLYAKYKSTTE